MLRWKLRLFRAASRPSDFLNFLYPMLRYLSIRNLAVIESVAVDFDAGLNVLTGETGAGKSILVEAVGLLLGGRASSDLVRTGEEVADIRSACSRATVARSSSGARSPRRAGAARSSMARWPPPARSGSSPRGSIELHGQHEHQGLPNPERISICSTTSQVCDAIALDVSHQFAIVQRARDGAERAASSTSGRSWRASTS